MKELNIFIPHLQTSSLSFIFSTNTSATLTQKRGERIFEFKLFKTIKLCFVSFNNYETLLKNAVPYGLINSSY